MRRVLRGKQRAVLSLSSFQGKKHCPFSSEESWSSLGCHPQKRTPQELMLCQSRAKPPKRKLLWLTHSSSCICLCSRSPALAPALLSHPDRDRGSQGLCWWAQTLPHPSAIPQSLPPAPGALLAPSCLPGSLGISQTQQGTTWNLQAQTLTLPPNTCVPGNNKLWFPVPPKLFFLESKMKQDKHTCCKSLFRVQGSILFVHLFGVFLTSPEFEHKLVHPPGFNFEFSRTEKHLQHLPKPSYYFCPR